MKDIVSAFIEQIPELDHDERKLVSKALGSVDDYKKVCDTIESIQDDNPHCPHCGKTRVYRHGQSAGLQRYRCTKCGKTFNALTKTPLARMRKKELWISYIDLMLDSTVLRDIRDALPIDLKTAFLWRHHFSVWLSKDTPQQLEGIIEADETYFRKSKKGDKHLNRKPHTQGGEGSKRGLSKEQVCVLTACDRSQHSLEFITGLGPVKGKWLDNMIGTRVAHDAVLVTDGQPAYTHFCKHEQINHVVVMNKKGERVKGPYHIQHINAFHGRIKAWINSHFRGVATKYLNHYLWWRHELENKHISNAFDLFRASVGKSHT
jgi:transposase-like protein